MPGSLHSQSRKLAQLIGTHCLVEQMDKPRIFLGSSGKQEKLLQALTRGLEDVAHVEPWTTSFNPGTTTLERLLELTREVDFAAFVFAQDDWTTKSPPEPDPSGLRPGFSARQRGLRSRSVRCSPRNAPNLHPPCERLEASQRSPRSYVRALRSDEPCRDEGHQSEASEGDRERMARSPHRGPVVAVFPDGAHRAGAFGHKPLANLAGPRGGAGGGRPRDGRRMAPCQCDIGARLRRRGKILPASSTIGMANGRGTRTRRSCTGLERSDSSLPIARPGTGQRVRILTRTSTSGRPVFICAPIPRT